MQAQSEIENVEVAQLHKALADEQRRLEKLWDAYERQEREMDALMSRLQYLETDLEVKAKQLASMEEMLVQRDQRIRDLEVQQRHHNKLASEYEPRIDSLKDGLDDTQTKFDKLLAISEELEEELNVAKEALAARDAWFETHVGGLEEIGRIINQWRDIQKGSFLVGEAEADPAAQSKEEFFELVDKINGLTKLRAERLYKAGFNSLAKLKAASVDEITALEGITAVVAHKILDGVKLLSEA